MFKALLILLNLDGYRSLYCKFTDKSGLTYEEHNWVASRWEEVMYDLLRRRQIRKAWRLRSMWKLNDWGGMYETLLEELKVENVWAIAE